MYVIVGLGNPDKKYEHTRHNIGFDVIDALADKYNISVTDKKHKALCGSGVIEGMKVLLVKPQTYMNLSGESVAEVMNFYKLDPDEKMIVIFDDIYPRITGTITQVAPKEVSDTDETGKPVKFTVYRFKDANLTFSESYILPGQELHVIFQTGPLSGMDFALELSLIHI